jgi:predicted RNA-binding Zn-ribbon protein involved in translation (DUF1610 family)
MSESANTIPVVSTSSLSSADPADGFISPALHMLTLLRADLASLRRVTLMWWDAKLPPVNVVADVSGEKIMQFLASTKDAQVCCPDCGDELLIRQKGDGTLQWAHVRDICEFEEV